MIAKGESDLPGAIEHDGLFQEIPGDLCIFSAKASGCNTVLCDAPVFDFVFWDFVGERDCSYTTGDCFNNHANFINVLPIEADVIGC